MASNDRVTFDAVVAALHRPEAWGGATPEVKTTHASVVFLVGDRVYKLKQPVDFGFLDYSTLDRRERACRDEVRLNTPRAPGIYLGVVPIVADGAGHRVGGPGLVVEWAVEMMRLSEDACLLNRVDCGRAGVADMVAIGRKLARHHREAERGPEASRHATLDVVSRHALDNLDETDPGRTITPRVHARVRAQLLRWLAQVGPLIARRAAAGIPCDTHGDLRLEHVYLLPDGITFVDCIEFSDAYRYADPVSDLAFLTMDLAVRGEHTLAAALAEAWFEASGDQEGRALLPFYESYRSAVRGKVAGLLLKAEPDDRNALHRAQRHWLFALARLEEPSDRPCLIGIGGLPGTGKTTLARNLASRSRFEVVRSDLVRKKAGSRVSYSEADKDAVYVACLEQAEALLLGGQQVIVDASFGRTRWRRMLLDRGRALGVRVLLLRCEADLPLVLARLAARRGDASDADRGVYERAVREWESDGPGDPMLSVCTNDSEDALARAQRCIDDLDGAGAPDGPVRS